MRQTGVLDELDGTGPFTVFAPNNTAFENSNAKLLPLLANVVELRKMLRCHIVEGLLRTCPCSCLHTCLCTCLRTCLI